MPYKICFVMCLISCAAAAGPVTTGSLVNEMVDMHRLASFPEPAYETVQFSSYDRLSSVPGGEHWFANSDGFGRERIPNFEAVLEEPGGEKPGEYLMCDIEGPGAIVRLWTARIEGSVRVYLDDAEEPLYEGPAEKFFLHPYDSFLEGTGLTRETLEGSFYQRNAAYAPLPFAKRCRIVWIGKIAGTHFYEIQARKYEPGAEVVTFTPQDLKTCAKDIRRVAGLLADVDREWPYRSKAKPEEFSVEIEPGKTAEALLLEGPGAIERLVLRVDAPDIERALRQTLLYVQCDRHPWPQVQSPVGDFFGAAPGINPYTSVPFTVASDGTMTCRYVMPYERTLRILFENRGAEKVAVSGSVLPTEYTWDENSSMHFRARWRADHDLVASKYREMGVQDLPFLLGRGKGVYVGTAVMLLNPNNVPTPWGNWWGEGDEKIFVDDDVQPSTFGTGSEDYFNYAWSANDHFHFPYCGQPRNDGPANRGFVVNFRWHVLDPLPFKNSIAFYMELFSHDRTPDFSYARIGYHYARPGFVDDHIAPTNEDLRVPELPATWEPLAKFGAARFEFQPCEDLIETSKDLVQVKGGLWQGGNMIVWTPKKSGEQLKLNLQFPDDGAYSVMLAGALQPEGGSFRAEIDGAAMQFNGRDSVSLATPHHLLSRIFSTRLKDMKEGAHALTLIALEAGKPIGLDFLGIKSD